MMSPKIINILSIITIIHFQITFQYEALAQRKIKSFKSLFTPSNHSDIEIHSEKLLKMRKLISEGISEDEDIINNRSTIIPTLLFEIFDSFAYFLYSQKLTPIIETEVVENCFFDGILDNIYNDELIDIYISGSGKSLNDFGNEYICDYNLRRNVSYLTIHFYIATEHYIGDKEEFFGQDFFYIGLCLPRKCMNATKYLLLEPKVLNICQEVGLSNFKFYVNEDVFDSSTKLSKFYSVFLIVYIILNVLKIVVGIWRIIFLDKGYEGYISNMQLKEDVDKKNVLLTPKETENGNINENPSNDNENEKNNVNSSFCSQKSEKSFNPSLSFNKEINENLLSDGENLYNPFEDKEKNLPTYLKILKSLDFFDNLKILSKNSNRYYNSKSIKSLYIIRFFLMLMSIVHQIMYTQIFLPTKNFYNVEFYANPSFIFIKLCINASTFWITLDAILFGYKLMSYLKKEIKLSKESDINYLTFLKFLLLILPKFFVFLFAFLLLHLNSSKLTFELCKHNRVFSNYLYYNDTVQQMYYSLRNKDGASDFFKNFIPFRLNYIDFIENITIVKTTNSSGEIKNFTTDVSKYEIPSPFLTNTDLFVNVYLNEFYLIILMLIITYISHKLHNHIFDFVVLIINAILFLIPAFNILKPYKGNIEEQNYTLRYVLGQNYTEKYTHCFINFFYFGFLIGVMKFYLDQNGFNKKVKKTLFGQIRLPFQFCQKIITYINDISPFLKSFYFYISLVFLLLISSSFTFLEGNNISYNEKIQFVKIANITKFLFFYEKNLSGIFFFIFILMYICYPKYTFTKKISETTTFIIIERISFCFYTSFSYLVYAQFCVFIISIQMSYSNLFFNAVGMFFIIFIFSLLNTALLELPIRQLIKYYMNRNLEKKFLDIYNESFSRTQTFNIDEQSFKLN